MTYEQIYESVKSDFSKGQFKKLFFEMISRHMIYSAYTKDVFTCCLSHKGLIIFYNSLEEPINIITLNSIKRTGNNLFPRLFEKKIFDKLQNQIEQSELLSLIFVPYFNKHFHFFSPLHENSNKCLQLNNIQKQLTSTYLSAFYYLYIAMLNMLDSKIKEEIPDFKILDSHDMTKLRISKFFRNIFYLGYRQGKDGVESSDSEKTFGEFFKRKVSEYEIKETDFVSIWEKYGEFLQELFRLDLLIYGDDIDTSGLTSTINGFVSMVRDNGNVIEFRSWLSLKNLHPEICEQIINEHKELKNWFSGWISEIKKFSNQNNELLNPEINQ